MSTKIIANKICKGNVIKVGGRTGVVHAVYHVKPGKGGAFIQLDMKDIVSGTMVHERLISSAMVDKPMIEEVSSLYLYSDKHKIALMDERTCEQNEFNISLCDAPEYLKDGMHVNVVYCESSPISINVPEVVDCVVTETEVVVKGQTASSSFKPAILDNGVRVMVPPFVKTGDKILVKTAEGAYHKRA